MYPVAQRAVFRHRVVFPEKGSAFVCMTDETVLVDAQLPQFCRTWCAVRVMAVTAYYLALPNRVGGYLVGACAYILVTAITYLGLGGSFLYLAGAVDRVTVGTCHVITFVGTGWPVHK